MPTLTAIWNTMTPTTPMTMKLTGLQTPVRGKIQVSEVIHGLLQSRVFGLCRGEDGDVLIGVAP